jgi:drug/metabolite transporter (DMT)-like permease
MLEEKGCRAPGPRLERRAGGGGRSPTPTAPRAAAEAGTEDRRHAGHGAAFLAVGAQTVIAAGTFLIAKQTLVAIPPLALALLRMAGAALLMGLVLRFRPRGARSIPRAAWPALALLGVIGVTVNQSAFLAGLARSTPTHAALLYALTPAGVHLIAIASREERWNRRRALGIGLALLGAVVIIGVPAPGPERAATRAGDLLIFVGVIAWAVYTAWAPRYVQALGAIRFTAGTLITGALAALPFGAWTLGGLDPGSIPAGAWLGLGFLVVFTSGIAYALWTVAMKGLSATQVAVFVNFQPVLTALLSIWLLGETITWTLLAGGALVCLGVAATQSEARRSAGRRRTDGA